MTKQISSVRYKLTRGSWRQNDIPVRSAAEAELIFQRSVTQAAVDYNILRLCCICLFVVFCSHTACADCFKSPSYKKRQLRQMRRSGYMGRWDGWLLGWWVGWLVGWLVGWPPQPPANLADILKVNVGCGEGKGGQRSRFMRTSYNHRTHVKPSTWENLLTKHQRVC